MYDKIFLDLLRSKVVLSDVISKRIKIINKGHTKVACCPFHQEKTPSFHINDSKGFYHCFGCGAHGDIISFVMQQDGLQFKEAIERIAEENGIELPKLTYNDSQKQKEIKNEIDLIYEINEKSCQFFEREIFLQNGRIGLNYITQRGLNLNAIKKFRIGFAPKGFDFLINYLKEFGYNEDQMIKAGVIAKSENSFYDKFRNRVIFPVFDNKGRIIAFTGRVVNKLDMPKYMNSPETVIFHKGNVLFNYFFARKAIYDNNYVFLVEGNLDAISMFINGIENVVAPMGTAITLQQITELWKNTDEIIVCLDGDDAGQKASKRLALLILPILLPTKNMKFIFLPKNQDPDDFIKINGKNGFLNYIKNKDNCLSLSEFLWNFEIKDLNIRIDNNNYITPEEKTNLESRLNKIINEIKNPIISKNFQNFYKQQLFLISKYDINSKRAINYAKQTSIQHRMVVPDQNSIDGLMDSIKKIDINIFSILFKKPILVNILFEKYNIDFFSFEFYNDFTKELFNLFNKVIEENLEINDEFLNKILEKYKLNAYIINNNIDNFIDAYINQLYGLILDRDMKLIEIEMKELSFKNNNEDKRKIISLELEKLKIKKNNLEEEF